ncbi:type 11 methyltransferase [Strigomonas culicis]|uniref:Type 11 methyltransferase n=1 Tax=Strigomonas culicis TaxID=28005 RepID=S9TKU3_9TRYP|nr:type 11 methyltransferase [Strigomonas culicis]|eukprot:EPY16948.1 type 11 methyltransferase [Strigomonas culicis]
MMETLLNMKQSEPKQGPGTFSGTTAAATRRNMREMFVPPTSAPASSAAPAASTPRSTPHRPSGTATGGGKGPTLDELKQVNLGPEIEALFEELRTVRAKKNSYRDKYQSADAELQRVQKEWTELKQTEGSLREKIKRSERDVMLLTSENMALQESSKRVKELTAETARLQQRLRQAEQRLEASRAAGTPAYEAVRQQLQAREDALRSLQRKVDRMRRRDPLLQFSIACSDVGRLCLRDGGRDPGKAAVEDRFEALSARYAEAQRGAWEAVAQRDAGAATVYVAAARRFAIARIPHAHLDAVVTVDGDAARAAADFAAAGFAVAAATTDAQRLTVTAPTTAEALRAPGPYGYAVAARVAPPPDCGYAVASVHPLVSPELLDNPRRCVVSYETARASGPGGQATNVTETQVYAKLQIDGEPAYTAEAQDSRSAMSNREAALQKLKGPRRVQYNETLARQQRVEEVCKTLAAEVAAQGGLAVEPQLLQWVHAAAASGAIPRIEESLVLLLAKLGQQHTGTPSTVG